MVLIGTFDQVLEKYIGEFGRWQIMIFFLIALPMMTPTIFFPSFGIYIPPHRCSIPYNNISSSSSDDTSELWSYDNITAIFIPLKNNPEEPPMTGQKYYPCRQRRLVKNSNMWMMRPSGEEDDDDDDKNKFISCQFGVTFDPNSDFHGSLVEEFNLVCDRAHIAPLTTSVYMAGSIIACWVTGSLSDHFGRRKVILSISAVYLSFSFGVCFSPNVYVFALFRFVIGFCEFSNHVTSFLILMEITTSKYRNYFSALIALVVGFFAYSFVPLTAYLSQNWRFLHAAIACFTLPTLAYYWLLPESPRWLIANKRESLALEVIETAIKINNPKLKHKDVKRIMQEMVTDSSFIQSSESIVAEAVQQRKSFILSRFINLFKTPQLRKTTLSIIFTWVEIGMIYYGSAYYSVNFKGNIYLIYWLMGVVAIPGGILSFTLYTFFGRKWCFLTIQGIAVPLIASAAICQIYQTENHQEIYIVIVISIAKILCDASYSMIYIYTPELFPTDVRNAGFALCASMGRIGAALSPVVVHLGRSIWRPLPFLIFTIANAVGGLCVFLLPETKWTPLCDTVAELQQRNDKRTILVECDSNKEFCTTENHEEIQLVEKSECPVVQNGSSKHNSLEKPSLEDP